MLTTTHLNLLSWLQDADYDVWLYLYNNYLVHVVNARSMKAEIHRPLQFKRMFKDLQRGSCHRDTWLRESRSYCRYLRGRYSISASCMDENQSQQLYLCGMPLQTWSPQNAWEQQKPHQCFLDHNRGSKETCIDQCEKLDIHYRKSWTKGKIVTQMLAHEDNCYD